MIAVLRMTGTLRVEPHQRASAERHVRTGIDCAPLGRLVRAPLCRARVHEAMLTQPPHGPVPHAPDNPLQRLLGRSTGVVEARGAILGARKYAIHNHGVEMQVQAAAEALKEVDRAVLGP